MSFDLAATLRRLKPQRDAGALARRADAKLTFVAEPVTAGPALLLDTTVYIDALQQRLPAQVRQLLVGRQINHSAIAIAELVHGFGRLDPAHPETRPTLAAIEAVIEVIPRHRLIPPSVQATIEAGIVTGLFARRRSLHRHDRQPLLNDATLLLQAIEHGFCLLTRNIGDFDLIQQLVPAARVLFYRQTG